MTLESLAELRKIERADVYKQGRHAATLTRTPDGVTFEYLSTWISQGGPAIASTLPVSTIAQVRPGGGVPAYFSGLLPEGRRLGALRREIKTSADDELSLLLGVGGDVVGDVQVLPEGEMPGEVPPRVEVSDFSEISFAHLLAEQGIRTERIGIAGFQDKVSAAVLNLPVAQRGARFILKLNPPEFPHVVENEAFFLRAAKLSGLNSASARIVSDVDGKCGLLVRRFDRVAAREGGPRALAVEDASQALGRPPADKYLISSEDAFMALSNLCLAPRPAARIFITQLVFAYLTGNGDAHAKNFSVLQLPTGEWQPSPAYDLPSTYFYGDNSMAMTVGGKSTDLDGSDFVGLGDHLGLPERAVRRVMDEVSDRVDLWLPLINELPFPVAQAAKFVRVLNYRRKRLKD
ncbi:MAG: type II toxin-antitoxin system HipA family toxin [Candidatus Nanopelagicaceae bacterium]|nr:type II toxin-antitoxin system HipA family toxin [Candidatus Nanopelagicaceae bacterium]